MRGRDPFFARPPPTAGRRWPSNRRESIGDGIPRNLADDWIERRRSRSLLTKQQPLVRLPSGRNGRQGRYSDWFSAAVSAIRFLLLFLAVFFSFYVGVFTFCFFFADRSPRCLSVAALAAAAGRGGKPSREFGFLLFSFVFILEPVGATAATLWNVDGAAEESGRLGVVISSIRMKGGCADHRIIKETSQFFENRMAFFFFFYLRNALIAPTILLV